MPSLRRQDWFPKVMTTSILPLHQGSFEIFEGNEIGEYQLDIRVLFRKAGSKPRHQMQVRVVIQPDMQPLFLGSGALAADAYGLVG